MQRNEHQKTDEPLLVDPTPALDADDSPRFCRSCDRPRSRDRELCPECGDRLEVQGYCTVCDSHWRLPAGAICPKHDLPLLVGRPETAVPGVDGEPTRWVTVCGYIRTFEAEAACLRLDAEGIPTLLDGHRMATNTSYQVATGGVRLQVPESCAQEARILLSQSWAVPGDDDQDDDEVDWDDVAPVRDEPIPWRWSTLFWAALLIIIAGVIGLWAG